MQEPTLGIGQRASDLRAGGGCSALDEVAHDQGRNTVRISSDGKRETAVDEAVFFGFFLRLKRFVAGISRGC